MIYLWVENEGWKEFELSNTDELEKRNIIIGDGAHIGYRAHIGDGNKPTIVYIIGSRFSVSYWGENRVDIGCTSRSIEEWLTDSTDIAEKHNFTTEAVAEYRASVEFIKTVHDRNREMETQND